MARLTKPTEMLREQVSQEIRRILGPDVNTPADSYRHVQLLVPSSPTVLTWLTDTADEDVAMIVGPNRGTYKGAVMSAGTTISFYLLPEQTIWAAAEEKIASLALIVEYKMEV